MYFQVNDSLKLTQKDLKTMIQTLPLWNETRLISPYEMIGSTLRAELNKEKVERIDLSYLGHQINRWWAARSRETISHLTHSDLKMLILSVLKTEHLEVIQNIGNKSGNVAAVLMEHVFSFAEKDLGLLVHEVMAGIAGIVDIKYPYEEHKELYPKNDHKIASDWGKGLGIIRPHSDDLYEAREINAMCLTVCKDISSTPTWFWLIKDVISCLSDEELGMFAMAEATFISGTNVEGKPIEVKKQVFRSNDEEGIGFRMDFRIDDHNGPRMTFADPLIATVFEKLKSNLNKVKPLCTNASTGSVSVLSNFKVLHGRSALNPVMLYEGEKSRILFRSKGIK